MNGELLTEIRLLRRDLAELRRDLAELRQPRTPRQARSQRRGALLREIAAATPHAPASWAAAAELAAMLQGERPAPAGCDAALRRLRDDPEVPRSARRILDHLTPDATGIDAIDALLRQWNVTG